MKKELEMLAEALIDGSRFSGTKAVEVETPAWPAGSTLAEGAKADQARQPANHPVTDLPSRGPHGPVGVRTRPGDPLSRCTPSSPGGPTRHPPAGHGSNRSRPRRSGHGPPRLAFFRTPQRARRVAGRCALHVRPCRCVLRAAQCRVANPQAAVTQAGRAAQRQ